MWISKFRIQNFSSFSDSGWIELDAKFNLFIGQNNSGKSALLRSICHPLPNNSHKSADRFRGADLAIPIASFSVQIEVRELLSRFRRMNEQPTFPCGNGEGNAPARLAKLLNNPSHLLTLELERKAGEDPVALHGASIPEFRDPQQQVVLNFAATDQGFKVNSRVSGPDNLSRIFSGDAQDNVFYFDAQRINVGRSVLASPDKLLPNAGNLPAVLAALQGTRRPVFDLIEEHVTKIFGGMERITVAPRPNNEFEILIWPDRSSIYEELAFSLNDSGTGVGQLLAIITSVVTSDQSIIVIDEINSFLHPTAVKKLLSLLRSEYPHHQYLISTHSSDAIAGASAEKLYIVHRDGFESSVRPVELKEAQQARDVASVLGFSMMDVFGYDRMIWVEGPTEEICFPFLTRKYNFLAEASVGFAPVASTSSFGASRRTGRSTAEIYEQAGKRLSPLLRGMAFALDRERLSDAEASRLEKSHRKLRFLPRRCFECYLLVPEAILSVVCELDTEEHSLESVKEALQAGADEAYGGPRRWNGDLTDPEWLKRVDGAKLLDHVFASLTDHRVEYRKTRDAISLLKWILENLEQHLSDLVSYLRKVVEVAMRDTPP